MPRTLDNSPDAPPAASGWTRFWFAPADPFGLHVVRVLTGLVLLTWLLSFVGRHVEVFGLQGWLDRTGYVEASRLPEGSISPIGWSPIFLAGSAAATHLLYAAGIVVAALLALGLWTRITSVLAWLMVVTFTASPILWYGGDAVLLVLTFYVMVGCLLDRIEEIRTSPRNLLGPADGLLWRMAGGSEPAAASTGANLAVRLLQVHFAILLITTGLHKLQMATWWSGAAFFFPLYPPFETSVESLQEINLSPSFLMTLLSLGAYLMIAWQISFPFLAWRPWYRPVLLLGAVAGWLGNWLVFRMPLFGPTLFIGCLAFVPGATLREWTDAALVRLGLRAAPSLEDVLARGSSDVGVARVASAR